MSNVGRLILYREQDLDQVGIITKETEDYCEVRWLAENPKYFSAHLMTRFQVDFSELKKWTYSDFRREVWGWSFIPSDGV